MSQIDDASPSTGQAGTQGSETVRRRRRRAITASTMGAIVEHYDFLLYATAATLVFPHIFFPTTSSAVGMIASFGTLAVGYVARPVGGIVFGHLGDRLGRKNILLWTLIMMGMATILVGLLPTYEQIGIAAPILLIILRLVQGVAVGGEWGGAALMAVEHASERRRGLAGSIVQTGNTIGLVLSFAAFAALGVLSQEAFLSWGWRIPFLATIVIVALGIYIRLGVSESPLVEESQAAAESVSRTDGKQSIPLFQVLKERPGRVALGIFLYAGPFMAYAVATTMLVGYANTVHGVDRSVLTTGVMLGTVGMLFTLPLYAWISDKIGRTPVYVVASVLTAGQAFLMFPLVTSGSFGLIFLSFLLSMTVLNAAANGLLPAYLSELFPTEMRYTGISVTFQLSGVIGGGLGPLIAATFIVPGGPGPLAVSSMIAVLCLVAAVCAWKLGDTRNVDLRNA